MEILNVNVSYIEAIITLSICILAVIYSLWAIIAKDSELIVRIFGTLVLLICLFVIFKVIASPKVTTYEVIVHDWNEVYDNDYEVLEKKGELVILRKVD